MQDSDSDHTANLAEAKMAAYNLVDRGGSARGRQQGSRSSSSAALHGNVVLFRVQTLAGLERGARVETGEQKRNQEVEAFNIDNTNVPELLSPFIPA